EWLTRVSAKSETLLVLALGLLLGLLTLLRPLYATFVALAASGLLLAVTWWALWHRLVWFDWMVPFAVQVPVGLFWSLGAQYYLEARRRKELRRAFGFYLSPQMADKISNSDFDLTPGGKTVEATIMFTDLEGFTTLAENLDPAEVSKTLIAYFERTTACILKSKGTIVKYVGDAVMAGWGAPVAQPNHALLAAEAACDLRCLADIELHGRRLRTRIGVNTGKVLAGNLGSSFRFDYSMIGDTTNFASRLEALNKYLGTQVLISESTRAQLNDRIVVRPLGEFLAAGKTKSVLIHELICRCGDDAPDREWLDCFAAGLREYQAGNLEPARAFMRQTASIRGLRDGPSEFYLKTMDELERDGTPQVWTGVVQMKEK
ncbi:MAG: adenylate/guanylate cyclase domain-containing protein, partial [Chthoniobacterales bacterium]